MSNYFDAENNLKIIQAQQRELLFIHLKERIDWLVSLKTEHHQDALHIAKRFLNVYDTDHFFAVKDAVEYFYRFKHLYPAEQRDIKQFKRFVDLSNLIEDNSHRTDNDFKTTKKELKPIFEDKSFIIFLADTFIKSRVLTKGHPAFGGNHFNLCTANPFQYDRHTRRNLDPKEEKITTTYFIRDKRKTTTFDGQFPRCKFHDDKHIILLHAGVSPLVTHADKFSTKKYESMDKVYKDYPDLIPYKNILIHR